MMLLTLALLRAVDILVILASPLKLLLHLFPWVLIFILAIAVIFYFVRNRQSQELVQPDNVVTPSSPGRLVLEFSRYITGHPEIPENLTPCLICIEDGFLRLCSLHPEEKTKITSFGSIPVNDLVEIRVEDLFTLKRTTNSEIWKEQYSYLENVSRRPDDDLAFIVMEWDSPIKRHFTYLSIEGEMAMEMAVKKRNALMKMRRMEQLQPA